MTRRPRRRRAKRSTSGRGRQRRQLLTKEIRERYTPGSTDGDPDAEWHAGLEEELDAQPRRGGRGEPSPAPDDGGPPPAGKPAAGPELRGRVVAVSSGACRVETDDKSPRRGADETRPRRGATGTEVDCILPSDLARDQRAAVAVGDRVVFTAHGAGSHRIRQVLERRTTLSRPDPHNPRLERVIAANIDVAVHVASVVEPPLRPALIDRYLIAIERGGAEAVICVNKIDLLAVPAERRRQLEQLDSYRRLGLEILPTSAVTGEGLDALHTLLAGKTAVFAGHSGAGKSSLLNALDPDSGAATAGTGGRGKGRHTTTRSSLYRLEGDIRIIDTPGIRELGLWQLTTQELRAYFPDFEPHAVGCRFNDCSHRHEPDCAVRQAVESGDVARARFETYLRILASLESGD